MRHVTPDEVIALHTYILRRYAGVPGISDPGRADAIVGRVLNQEYYEGITDIYELAATYWLAIARGHIFIDGSKRTALNTTMLFLKRNGVEVYDRPELVELTVKAAKGEFVSKQLATKLREFFKPKISPY
ncbi:type II toxin-antitoxin system death-on-curing family toxin [Xenorhabdus sp. IM139775]|uniref:type II toxin-antitoxin system death-on-curing family toxin n=1 Tax=Xenorhabdus sp. IM139775 TaxID=3025876 RepID=UPI002358BB9C|nr:type II toxin-antitoxin system death-on-curing family toxin [Xenorhabdus sp. IM139775]MDC9592166.1 type II toxin-antitoxin system death-on-curing family toxin [Xenorhabdus sp. IM139775]